MTSYSYNIEAVKVFEGQTEPPTFVITCTYKFYIGPPVRGVVNGALALRRKEGSGE